MKINKLVSILMIFCTVGCSTSAVSGKRQIASEHESSSDVQKFADKLLATGWTIEKDPLLKEDYYRISMPPNAKSIGPRMILSMKVKEEGDTFDFDLVLSDEDRIQLKGPGRFLAMTQIELNQKDSGDANKLKWDEAIQTLGKTAAAILNLEAKTHTRSVKVQNAECITSLITSVTLVGLTLWAGYHFLLKSNGGSLTGNMAVLAIALGIEVVSEAGFMDHLGCF